MNGKITTLSSKRAPAVKMDVLSGHFATTHSHVTHCMDLSAVKSEMKMARTGAKFFADEFRGFLIDTVITLEHTKLIGAFLAFELSHAGINLNRDIAVVSPEITGDKMILRDNIEPYVRGKAVLILTATATTGMTISSALEGIRYYGGTPVGAATIFGGDFWVYNVPVAKLFGVEDLEEYCSFRANECPLCKQGVKVDALINSYGYSKI